MGTPAAGGAPAAVLDPQPIALSFVRGRRLRYSCSEHDRVRDLHNNVMKKSVSSLRVHLQCHKCTFIQARKLHNVE